MRVSVLMACAVLLATVARGQVAPTDVDGDGVEDSIDECTDTEPGDMVDADGCSVCPCEETADGDESSSHDAYVQCVAAEAKHRRRKHMIKRKAMRALIKQAKVAACGSEELTRCCTYTGDDDTVGACKVMTVDKCDALWEESDYVDDAGPGSCTPNPCGL